MSANHTTSRSPRIQRSIALAVIAGTLIIAALGSAVSPSMSSAAPLAKSATHGHKACSRGKKRVHGHCRRIHHRKHAARVHNPVVSAAPLPSGNSAAGERPPASNSTAGASAPATGGPLFAASSGGSWNDKGIVSVAAPYATTSCFLSETASGNGVTNNGNGGAVYAYFPMAAGLYVRPWLYVYSAKDGSTAWIPDPNNGGNWYGPLADRGSEQLSPSTNWHINSGSDVYVRVLWQIADWDTTTNTGTIVGAWAPNYIQGINSAYTEYCHWQ